MDAKADRTDAAGGNRSLDLALDVLLTLARQPGPVGLSDLARLCGLSAPKVHRYLASFAHAGLVAQTGRSAKYDLGPSAIRLGLAALDRHDFVDEAADGLDQLVAETGMTAMVCVWGDHGPTVVRWRRATALVVASMGLGTTLPLLTSATGRVFLAWLPGEVTRDLLDAEFAAAAKSRSLPADLDATPDGARALAETVRAAGHSGVDGKYIPGLVAAAAPVLDWQNEVQAVVTLIGTQPEGIDPDGMAVKALKAHCAARSLNRGDESE